MARWRAQRCAPLDILYIHVYIYIYLKAHSAGPATVPWGHSGTASENMLVVPVMFYEQVKLSPMVHKFILRVYIFPLNQTYA